MRNFKLRALHILTAILAVVCLAHAAPAQTYKTYDYSEHGKEYRVIIPASLNTVRGLLVVCNYSGGDSREYYRQNWYAEFMELHGFAFVGSKGNNSHLDSYRTFLRAIKQISIYSRHTELLNAPYATTGFSAGGGFASTLLTQDPAKVIACAPVGARINFDVFAQPDGPKAAHLGVPTCLITGEQENSAAVVDPVFIPYRPRGALFSWVSVQGIGHEMVGQEVLAMAFLDAVVRLRYPSDGDTRTGLIQLKPLEPGSGWVADNGTWKSGITAITPASQFHGDLGHSSWLPTKDIAFIYRAYSSYDRPMVISSPSQENDRAAECKAGADLTIVIDATHFANWRKLELYDGATKLSEITQAPTSFVAKRPTPGYHVFSVLGKDSVGNIRSSNPVMVIARTNEH